MTLTIRTPKTPKDFEQRALLLQSTMRQPQDPFAIETEYPIVLNPSAADFSLCGFVGEEMVAHLNLWPRTLVSSSGDQTMDVALVGNVASRADVRGRGYMQAMFAEAERLAQQQSIAALILWSDLHQFYQKLGFTSASREFRFRISMLHRTCDAQGLRQIQPLSPNSLCTNTFRTFLQLRPKARYTVERSPDEFGQLANIPATYIFATEERDAYCIIGKGVDMQGVVHEWGANSPCALMSLLTGAAHYFAYAELLLLAPTHLDAFWLEYFKKAAQQAEIHDMAFVKPLRTSPHLFECLKQTFVWGLDSI